MTLSLIDLVFTFNTAHPRVSGENESLSGRSPWRVVASSAAVKDRTAGAAAIAGVVAARAEAARPLLHRWGAHRTPAMRIAAGRRRRLPMPRGGPQVLKMRLWSWRL